MEAEAWILAGLVLVAWVAGFLQGTWQTHRSWGAWADRSSAGWLAWAKREGEKWMRWHDEEMKKERTYWSRRK
jgi:hypothetical protein